MSRFLQYAKNVLMGLVLLGCIRLVNHFIPSLLESRENADPKGTERVINLFEYVTDFLSFAIIVATVALILSGITITIINFFIRRKMANTPQVTNLSTSTAEDNKDFVNPVPEPKKDFKLVKPSNELNF